MTECQTINCPTCGFMLDETFVEQKCPRCQTLIESKFLCGSCHNCGETIAPKDIETTSNPIKKLFSFFTLFTPPKLF